MKNILMCGFRKNSKESSVFNLNGKVYSKETFIEAMSYINSINDQSNWIYKGTFRLKVSDILNEINKGPLWCESKDFCYLFKYITD